LIRHIIFDFDGTIADSMELGLKILHTLSGKYKIRKFEEHELTELGRLPIKERLKIMGIPKHRLPRLSMDFLHLYRHQSASLNAFSEVGGLLLGLKDKGYGLSIISSNSYENISDFLGKNNITAFDAVISEKNLFGKDKPIKKHLSNLCLDKHEVIYIGDELRDIEACKKAGIRIISVAWGADPVELLAKGDPDFIAYKPMDILKIINEIE
jgi:phosphoglycolate phosphatase